MLSLYKQNYYQVLHFSFSAPTPCEDSWPPTHSQSHIWARVMDPGLRGAWGAQSIRDSHRPSQETWKHSCKDSFEAKHMQQILLPRIMVNQGMRSYQESSMSLLHSKKYLNLKQPQENLYRFENFFKAKQCF